MSETSHRFNFYARSPLVQLIITILMIFTLGLALMTIMTIPGFLISGLSMNSLSGSSLPDVGAKNIGLLRYLMVCQEIALFIVPAIIIRKNVLSRSEVRVDDLHIPELKEVTFVVLLAFCLFPITNLTGELNEGLKLPSWLSGVEQWMKNSEDQASDVLDLLVPSGSLGILMLNIFIIGVLPAVSEELIFRGVIQRIFYGFFKSVHPAIWITAFIFSAVHLQFYGFVPRLILGLVFGYLYFWSGTLWLPVIAHFVNNAVPVVWIFIKGSYAINSQVDITIWKQLVALPVPLIVSVWILIYFRNRKLNSG